jgi:hypothetical protein
VRSKTSGRRFTDHPKRRFHVTDRVEQAGSRTKRIAPDQSGPTQFRSSPVELIDRVEKLRKLLPAFAEETAAARREAAHLRSQNTKLQRRVAELETRFDITNAAPRPRAESTTASPRDPL